jgi:hypothetical protein
MSAGESRYGAEGFSPNPPLDDDTDSLRTSRDLLRDARYLDSRAAAESNVDICSIYARAAIIMGFATIEAVTNDALAEILHLLTGEIPAGRRREPPWRHFAGRSARRVDSLLRNGAFRRKRDYVLGQIQRTTGKTLEPSLAEGIERLRDWRNRIVHMNDSYRPDRYKPMLDAAETKRLAGEASGCAGRYLDFVSRAFAEIALPIRTLALAPVGATGRPRQSASARGNLSP